MTRTPYDSPEENAVPKTITFVLWDGETDGVAVKHDGETVWQESTFDRLDQYFRNFPPTGEPVVIEVESA